MDIMELIRGNAETRIGCLTPMPQYSLPNAIPSVFPFYHSYEMMVLLKHKQDECIKGLA